MDEWTGRRLTRDQRERERETSTVHLQSTCIISRVAINCCCVIISIRFMQWLTIDDPSVRMSPTVDQCQILCFAQNIVRAELSSRLRSVKYVVFRVRKTPQHYRAWIDCRSSRVDAEDHVHYNIISKESVVHLKTISRTDPYLVP